MRKNIVFWLTIILVMIFIGCKKEEVVQFENIADTNTYCVERAVVERAVTSSYGWGIEFEDVKEIKPYFAYITDYDTNSVDIRVKIDDVKKTFTATEFFTLLGFDMNEPNEEIK